MCARLSSPPKNVILDDLHPSQILNLGGRPLFYGMHGTAMVRIIQLWYGYVRIRTTRSIRFTECPCIIIAYRLVLPTTSAWAHYTKTL